MTDIVTYCDVNTCEDCLRYGDDCDGDKRVEHTDLISRADAIDAVCRDCSIETKNNCKEDGYCYEVRNLKALPSADAVQGEWEFVDNEIFAGEYFCSICGKRAEVDLYGEWILSNFCPMCGAEMADNSLVNNITESPNDVIESQDDVIKKPRTVRYKLHKPIEYVSIEFDEEEEITQIGHYTAYGERREP